MNAARIESLDAWLLRLPLAQPYKLSFGPLAHFDTLLVQLRLSDGREGFGEATLLPGYSEETVEGTWATARGLIEQARPLGPALQRLAQRQPFLVTAFRTAHEMALASPWLTLDAPARVPLLGLLQAERCERVPAAVEALLAQGFRTLKVKVGFDPVHDAAFVAAAQRAVDGRAMLRLDANQGYSVAQANEFLQRIAPDHIELFEQPCAAGDWDAHLAVVPAARRRGVALMLDESIYDERDIERAAQLQAARFIKLKLMKMGSLQRLADALARIRARGMVPVLGNGVANEPGCWMESCVAARCIDNAGEQNGFLKPLSRLFAQPLPFVDGAIVLGPGEPPRLDADAVAAHSLAHAQLREAPLTFEEQA